jgi:hypothetical protein
VANFPEEIEGISARTAHQMFAQTTCRSFAVAIFHRSFALRALDFLTFSFSP